MRVLVIVSIVLSSILISGCQSGFKIIKTVDSANPDFVIYKSSRIKIKGNSSGDTYEAFMRYFKYYYNNKQSYALDILYRGSDWGIFTGIILDIDGIVSEYKVKRAPIRIPDGLNGLTEELVIEIPLNKINELIENRKCKMTVVGKNLKIEVFFKQDWFDKLIQLYATKNS